MIASSGYILFGDYVILFRSLGWGRCWGPDAFGVNQTRCQVMHDLIRITRIENKRDWRGVLLPLIGDPTLSGM